MTAREQVAARLQYAVARVTGRLPDRVNVLLSGEPPIRIDGRTFDAHLQLLTSLRRRLTRGGLLEPTIAAARDRYRDETRVFRGPVTRVGDVRAFDVPGAEGALRARHYAPPVRPHTDPAPLTVYLHGGGFVIGDLDTHDEPCRILCGDANVHVLSIEYRLAPEHPFPAAVDDGLAAFEWACAHAAALGADPRSVGIAGDSAGGNLAAVVSALTSRSARRPRAQLLIYPGTDASTPRRSHELFGHGFLLTARDRADCIAAYAGRTASDDPRVSPLKAAVLSGLPPALVVIAGFDVLRDEGTAYAQAMAAAGTRVEIESLDGLEHGFIHLTGVSSAARLGMRAIAVRWGGLLREDATA